MTQPLHPDAESLALLALGEDVDGVDRDHLERCATCRSDLAGLRAVVTDARDLGPDDVPVIPPPTVWDRIQREVERERPAPAASPPLPSGDASVVPLAGRRRVRTPLLALAACLAGLAGGIPLGLALRPAPPAPEQRLATADLNPLAGSTARGTAEVVTTGGGRRIRLSVSNLPGRDGFYEAWLLDPATMRLIGLGTLPASEGAETVTLPVPAGVDLAAYPAVDVSLEPLDGNPGHSGDSVARGALRT
jgi:hypothetical protein